MKAENIYYVAEYLRISKDDGDIGSGKSESDSISSQRDLIRSFIHSNEDMVLYDIYVDDGYSGANFDRPEFKRMMKDVEAGKVNCVIVKDLSRFGRDYIEAGRLIQKTFPAFNVRFIAITDKFDTLTADENEKTLVLPIKNFVNDSYTRDISQKVKSEQRVKRENGDFVGAFAVYGYRKHKDNRNQLVVDDYAAEIVKQIFAWRIAGMSMSAIAKRLNDKGILSPMEYKKSNGEKLKTGFAVKSKAEWSTVAVKRILTNEVYTGMMVQGKSEVLNHKIKQSFAKPPEEWTRVADKHEAIISQEDFDNAGKMELVDCRAIDGAKTAHMFAGLLFCGDCKEPMIRRVNHYKGKENVSFICQTRNKGIGCTRHSIAETQLQSLVLQTIQTQVAVLMDGEQVLHRIRQLEVDLNEVIMFDREVAKLREDQDKYLKLRTGLYEDLQSGIINEDDFHTFRKIYEEHQKNTQIAIEKQEQTIKELFKTGISAGVKLEKFKEALTVTGCSRELLMSFVSTIHIYENKRVCIELKCQEQFQKILMLADYIEVKTGSEFRREAI